MSESLSQRLVMLLERPVDAAARERAALHVLDWLGCALLGATTEPGRILVEHARRHPAGPSAAVRAGRREAGAAAFVNGGLGNLHELDDLHRLAIVHPGPVVVPAALAVAERSAADGRAFLDAVVRGYEATIRIGGAAGLAHYEFWHKTATCGVFGAAVAAASVLELSPEGTVDALGHAGSQASGLWQCRLEPTMTKHLHTARAAQSGVIAADLAALEFAAAKRILEGPLGFFAATCPDAEPEAVTAHGGAPWKVFETSFKPWPACRHAHPVIEAALDLGASLDPTRVEDVEIVTYRDAVAFCDAPEPRTPHEARFSLQHCVAVTLIDGAPGLEAFEPDAIVRPEVASLRRRVSVREGADHTAAFPGRFGAEVAVSLGGGDSRHTVVLAAKGDPENPMSGAEIEAKARTGMTAAGLPRARVEALIAAVAGLAEGGLLAAIGDAVASFDAPVRRRERARSTHRAAGARARASARGRRRGPPGKRD